jgi:hypothetical protein
MSRNRFEAILAALCYTNQPAPSYNDRFWEVRLIQDEWNANMAAKFVPSWINAIDESIKVGWSIYLPGVHVRAEEAVAVWK